MSISHHHEYMQKALALAKQGLLTVTPNPMVGCILVNDHQIVGTGFHHHAGGPHAEVLALLGAKEKAQGASAYVTLEPCCHHGRTPPCTNALIKAGIKKVYIACEDPNPLVSGKGIAALKAANIEVQIGIEEQSAKKLNEIFFHYMQYQRPFVIAKWAMSLDGKTVTDANDSRLISSFDAQCHTHQLRQKVDAILIGAETARQDNPLLTARFGLESARQPMRIILSREGKMPLDLNLFDIALPGQTMIITTSRIDHHWRQAIEEKGVIVLMLTENAQGYISISLLLDVLGKRGITSLLIEGGMSIHEQFIQDELVNQYCVYLAPTVIGKHQRKKRLQMLSTQFLGADICLTAERDQSHV